MPRYPKNHKDVEYYVRGRKRRVSGSTVATERFLVMVHQDHPDATISQLREIITDKTKYILCPEGLAVLDDHISYRAKGYKDGTEFDPSTKLGGQAAREALGAGA